MFYTICKSEVSRIRFLSFSTLTLPSCASPVFFFYGIEVALSILGIWLRGNWVGGTCNLDLVGYLCYLQHTLRYYSLLWYRGSSRGYPSGARAGSRGVAWARITDYTDPGASASRTRQQECRSRICKVWSQHLDCGESLQLTGVYNQTEKIPFSLTPSQKESSLLSATYLVLQQIPIMNAQGWLREARGPPGSLWLIDTGVAVELLEEGSCGSGMWE